MSGRLVALGAIPIVALVGVLVFTSDAGEALLRLVTGADPCAGGAGSPTRSAPLPAGWTRVSPPPEAAAETSIWDAAWLDDGWMAVGFSTANEGSTPGVTWVSSDGASWRAAAPFGANSSASSVAAVGSGAVVVGRYGNEAAAWHRSEPGWQPALLPSTPGPFASEAFLLDGDCGRLVAAGPEGDDLAPITWTSTDAREWERAELPGADVGTSAFGVAVTPEAQVVVGSGTRTDGQDGAMAWLATDGNDWRAIDLPGEAALASDVAATAFGFVAVGWSSDPAEGVIWRSEDGLGWDLLDTGVAFPDGARRLELTAVEAWGDGFVVAGLRRRSNDEARGLAWVAPDGQSLQRVAAPPEATLFDEVAVGPDGLVLIGRYEGSDGTGSPGTIWVGR